MLEPAYLFIDGGHLRAHYGRTVREWFGSNGAIDFEKLKVKMEAVKLFYYDSVDDEPRRGEDEATARERIARQRMMLDSVQEMVGSHVREGSMTGPKHRRQKEVDILLAVEMMNHAIRKNMSRVVLLAGDRDFRPVVDSLVQMGTFVVVVGDKAHVSRELVKAADSSILLTFDNYFELSARSLQAEYPLPVSNQIRYSNGFYEGTPVAQGELADGRIVIISVPQMYRAYVPTGDSVNAYTFDFKDAGRLKLYIKLRFGEVNWMA
jgi:uncharacterized LabA/DUF88 family protein